MGVSSRERPVTLLPRVADMRIVLGSKVTALSLYEEVSSLGIHKEDGTIFNLFHLNLVAEESS